MATLDARMVRNVALGSQLCQLRRDWTAVNQEEGQVATGKQLRRLVPGVRVVGRSEWHIPQHCAVPRVGPFVALNRVSVWQIQAITRLEQVGGTHWSLKSLPPTPAVAGRTTFRHARCAQCWNATANLTNSPHSTPKLYNFAFSEQAWGHYHSQWKQSSVSSHRNTPPSELWGRTSMWSHDMDNETEAQRGLKLAQGHS